MNLMADALAAAGLVSNEAAAKVHREVRVHEARRRASERDRQLAGRVQEALARAKRTGKSEDWQQYAILRSRLPRDARSRF